jgi:hypothetical protein
MAVEEGTQGQAGRVGAQGSRKHRLLLIEGGRKHTKIGSQMWGEGHGTMPQLMSLMLGVCSTTTSTGVTSTSTGTSTTTTS